MRRVVVCIAGALMVLGLAAGAAILVGVIGTESPAARAADGALVLVDLAALTGLSFLVWPRSAR